MTEIHFKENGLSKVEQKKNVGKIELQDEVILSINLTKEEEWIRKS